MTRQDLFTILTLGFWSVFGFNTFAQSDSDSISNSCQSFFESQKMALHYSYYDSSQTHDYSNNWDFDSDGMADELYFVGTGGAHLYYYLKIRLSSDQIELNFPFLSIDSPCFMEFSEIKDTLSIFPQFSVVKIPIDINNSKVGYRIYLHLDSNTAIPSEFSKLNIKSRSIWLIYKKDKFSISDFFK